MSIVVEIDETAQDPGIGLHYDRELQTNGGCVKSFRVRCGAQDDKKLAKAIKRRSDSEWTTRRDSGGVEFG
ncbi:hypothetical protein PG997_004859 [Apiospora hydei]|uniref:Uncharacterized protein n=1 Tax=Apiospora hydei TaxID=1337664 RepID=A0ABR1X3A6_9PEZI